MSATDLARIFAKARASGGLMGAPGVVATIGDLGVAPDRSIITKIGGVPVGFQFGTALGFDGMPALVLDVLSDPTTYLSGVGGFTKAARGGRVLRSAAASTARVARAGAAAGKTGTRGANKVLDGIELLSVARNLTKEDLFAHSVRGIELAGKMDTSRLHTIRKALEGAADDAIAEKAALRIARSDVGPRFKGMRGRLRSDPAGIGEETVEKAARRRGATPSSAQVVDVQTNRVLLAMSRAKKGETARDAGLRQINSELASRKEIVDLAAKAKIAPSVEGFEEIANKLSKLDISARARVSLHPKKLKDIRVAIDQIHKGKAAEAVSKAGEKGLLHFRTPLGTFSAGNTQMVERIGGALENIPGVRDVINRTKKGGLIPDAGGGRNALDSKLLLEEFQKSSAPGILSETTRNMANALRGVALHSTDFTSVNGAHAVDLQRTSMWAAKMETNVRAFALKFGWKDKDLSALIDLMDDPKKYIGNAITGTAKGRRSKGVKISESGPSTIPDAKRLGTAPASIKAGTFIGQKINPAGVKIGITDEHLNLAESLFFEMERAGKILKSQGAIDNVLNDYFPRLVAFAMKGKQKDFDDAIVSFFKDPAVGGKRTAASTFLGHGIPRIGLTLKQLKLLEARGIVKLEKDPAKILRSYFQAAGRATADARFLRRLKKATYETDALKGLKGEADQLPLFLVADKKGLLTDAQKAAKAAGEYEQIKDARLLELVREIGRAGGVNKKFPLSESESIPGVWKDAQTVWMPKSAAKAIRAVVGQAPVLEAGRAVDDLGEGAMRAALELNSFAKRSLLLVSAFHHMALTESAVAVLGSKVFTAGPRILRGRAIRNKQRDFFEATDVMDMAMRNGLQLGAPIDPQLDHLQKALARVDRIPGMNKFGEPGKMVGKGFAYWDSGLWDFYHNGLKLQSFHELFLRSMARPRFAKTDTSLLAQGVAEHVNNAFGGQQWERFWVGKRAQQWGRLLLLAPDWTVSNTKVATDVFMNFFKRKAPNAASINGRFPVTSMDILKSDVRATFSRQYALRASMAAAVGWNFGNWAMTSWNDGSPDFSKGRFLDGNEPGFRHMIDTGFSGSNGRRLFLKPGKQFREPFDLVESMYEGVPGIPESFVKRKLSPSARLGLDVITGRDMFGEPITSSENGPVSRIGQALGFAVKEFLPIPLQQVTQTTSGPIQALLGATGLPIRQGSLMDRLPGSQDSIEELLTNEDYGKGLEKARRAELKRLGL